MRKEYRERTTAGDYKAIGTPINRPETVMPYMIGNTEAVEKGL